MTDATLLSFTHGLSTLWIAKAAAMAFCVFLSLSPRAGAQNTSGQQRTALPQPIGQTVGAGFDDPSDGSPAEDEKLLRTLNTDRQKSMVADTNKLLRLVNELNVEIASTNPDSLTPAQLRKVAEIEKLAHSVKDKMSTSVRGTPAFQRPQLLLHSY
jgi:hypothetical protein